MPVELDTDNFNDDDEDIDDKDIDEIVDNLNLSLFDDEKKNNTIILNDKGFSDDSLSDIAGDIVKTFQETENDDLNVQEIVPSSSNPEMDGIFKDLEQPSNIPVNPSAIINKPLDFKEKEISHFDMLGNDFNDEHPENI